MNRMLSLVLIQTLLNACSSPGVLVGALDNTDFVTDRSTRLIVVRRETNANAFEIRTLGGEYVRTIGAGRFRIIDIDDRGQRFVARGYLGANFGFFATSVAGVMRPLPDGDEWYGAAIDPSGTRIAVTSNEKRLIRILSFDDLQTLQEIPCPQDAFCWSVAWDSMQADTLWLVGQTHEGYERLDLNTEESVRVPRDPQHYIRYGVDTLLHNSYRCRTSGATLARSNTGIELRTADSARSLVKIDGYRHHRFPAIDRAAFIADCRYVVFGFGGNDWLVDIESGLTGRLNGDAVYVLPYSTRIQ